MFPKLFEPITINRTQLKNRLLMPPMNHNYSNSDGTVSERDKAYFVERAKGGAALIYTGGLPIEPATKHRVNASVIWDDSFIPGLRELTTVIKKNGAKAGVQLLHMGRIARSAITGMPTVAPSPLPHPITGEVPHELTEEEIEELIGKFAAAARRAREAGFDVIDFHCCHGYLISQFLSARTNKRRDSYGGSLENRMRFPLRVIAAARREVGPDFALSCRISAEECVEGGQGLSETSVFAKRAVEAGVNVVSVSAGVNETPLGALDRCVPSMFKPLGCNVYLAGAIRPLLPVPVVTAGRIQTPQFAEEILENELADIIALGRELICDPEWPRKAMDGRLDEIRKCIACNECLHRITTEGAVACVYNAAAGNELELKVIPAAKPKKVVVVGGGPGGMETARVVALRGHRVILFEKDGSLGGQARLAVKAPSKQEFGNVIEYLSHEVKRLGVEIRLGQEADINHIRAEQPDAVVVATGAVPAGPGIEGEEERTVVFAHDLLRGAVEAGANVLVVGGGAVGIETAEWLASQGRRVTLIEMLEEIGLDMPETIRANHRVMLDRHGVAIMCRTVLVRLQRGSVVVKQQGNEQKLGRYDMVVLATGVKPNDKLRIQLEKELPNVFAVGDCTKPAKVLEAVYQGMKVACEL